MPICVFLYTQNWGKLGWNWECLGRPSAGGKYGNIVKVEEIYFWGWLVGQAHRMEHNS
jgi:hypothetical protein